MAQILISYIQILGTQYIVSCPTLSVLVPRC